MLQESKHYVMFPLRKYIKSERCSANSNMVVLCSDVQGNHSDQDDVSLKQSAEKVLK